MVAIRINGEKRAVLNESDLHWVEERIEIALRGGKAPCVLVEVARQGVDLRLATCACPGGWASPREFSSAERHVIALWRELELDCSSFTPSAIVRFVKRLQS